VAVASWREAVCIACALNMSDYVRVDIVSLEDIASRRLSSYDITSLQKTLTLQLAVLVGFKVSYTLEDFDSDNPAVTTQTLKENYARSVANETFNQLLVHEIEERTSDSAALVAKILPAEVTFGSSYTTVQTMDKPTGTFYLSLLLLDCELEKLLCPILAILSVYCPLDLTMWYICLYTHSLAHLLTSSAGHQCHRSQLRVHHHHAGSDLCNAFHLPWPRVLRHICEQCNVGNSRSDRACF